MPSDLRSEAIVLRRTNYGESDRILNLLTPQGKVSALAKSARKEKSRLAGGIELFSIAEVVIHQGRSPLGTLTSARMLHFYGNILSNFASLELASQFLKQIEIAADNHDNPEYFILLKQGLNGLNKSLPPHLVETWFKFNLVRAGGEEINLICDTNGEKLDPTLRYHWDSLEKALRPDLRGPIGANEIKIARFILTNQLLLAAQVENITELISPLNVIARTF